MITQLAAFRAHQKVRHPELAIEYRTGGGHYDYNAIIATRSRPAADQSGRRMNFGAIRSGTLKSAAIYFVPPA